MAARTPQQLAVWQRDLLDTTRDVVEASRDTVNRSRDLREQAVFRRLANTLEAGSRRGTVNHARDLRAQGLIRRAGTADGQP